MSVLTALFETYNWAQKNNLVDEKPSDPSYPVLLPMYHSSKRSATEKDIIEVTLSQNGSFLKAEWFSKDKVVIFPISESSIIRSGTTIAPHPLCDELSYLSKRLDDKKYKQYIHHLSDWVNYAKQNSNNLMLFAIADYIEKSDIFLDIVNSLLGSTPHQINQKNEIIYTDGSEKIESIDPKVMVTFTIETHDPTIKNLTVTDNQLLHKNYIEYVEASNKKKNSDFDYCDISLEYKYCVERHRGLLGNAKLIGISNHIETYYGRFIEGNEIVHIGYDTSQKIHLMLKYLLESPNNKRKIGENSYLINWYSDDINNKDGLVLTNSISPEEAREDEDDNFETNSLAQLGGTVSNTLNRFLKGEDVKFNPSCLFYILIIEKSSNGRISIKYFRQLPKSDIYKRVAEWYSSTSWGYVKKTGQTINRSPSLPQIVHFTLGSEEENKIKDKQWAIICRNKKLVSKNIERLLPCIIDGKRFPPDLRSKMLSNLYKRTSYDKSWDSMVQISCSIFKKCEIGDGTWKDGTEMLDINSKDRSYLFGRLLAIFEKAEQDSMSLRFDRLDVKNSDENINEHTSNYASQRSTNAQRLWAAFTHNPERTRITLETKMRPYWDRLQKSKPWLYMNYQKLLEEITDKLACTDLSNEAMNKPLNEKFIYGYYGQRKDFYKVNKNEQ